VSNWYLVKSEYFPESNLFLYLFQPRRNFRNVYWGMGGEKRYTWSALHSDEGAAYWFLVSHDIHILTLYFKQYTSTYKQRDNSIQQKVMYVGNNSKSLHISIEQSLKKLRTTYIDLLYVHWWDWDTSIEEVMRSLHTLILARKVLYLVRIWLLVNLPACWKDPLSGHLRHTCMGRL